MPRTYKLALLDDYQKVALKMADWDRLRKRGVEITVFHEPFSSVEDAAKKLAPFDMLGLLRERTAFPRALIEKLPNLKFMVLTGARASSLDDKAATDRGIPISNTPGGGSNASTAELCWALLMMCARDLAKSERLMRSGGWHDGIEQMVVLEGKRLGVIGLGRLGSRVAGYAKAFGMDVVAWSQNLTEEKAAKGGAKLVTKDELLKTSDFISIHLVLSDRTRGLLGAADLAKMKKSAILVNTSRGPIVDEAALLAALKEKRIAGFGADTYDVEPLPPNHPLRSEPRALLTPHLGYVTEETYRDFYGGMVQAIEAWLAGKPINVLA
jgi:phosphoglycerate dehydrogenase-like enzyme